MNALILSLAVLAQLGPERAVGDPPSPYERAVADPFSVRAVPAEFRPLPLPDLPDQVFAPAPLPPLPDEVFAPAPRRRIIRVVDRPATEPEPTPGIRRPAGDDESLLKRLAEVESRVDALERNRVAAGDRAALKLKSCSPYICNCNAGGECRAPDGCHCGPDHGPGVNHAATATPQAVKTWRGILGEPGVEGFGALNDAGQIVVEQRRYAAVPVAATPTYYTSPPTYYTSTPLGAPLGGFGAASVCGPGGCGVSGGRGIFGGLFR